VYVTRDTATVTVCVPITAFLEVQAFIKPVAELMVSSDKLSAVVAVETTELIP